MSETFTFAPAVRTNTPVIIGVAGASGSGKTFTALTLAMGLAGEKGKIAFVDTEGRRSLHYADLKGQDGKPLFRFDHCDFPSPYSPQRFLDALKTAEKSGYSVIILDSFSDEFVGEGGLVDMAGAEFERIKNSAAAWAKPKSLHKLVMRWFRQTRCHVIVCLRAENKVKLEKIMQNGREQTVVIPIGWKEVAEKNVCFEMTVSFMLDPEHPGVPLPIKVQEQHRSFFPLDKPVTRAAGAALAQWCNGGAAPAARRQMPDIAWTPDVAVDQIPEQIEHIATAAGRVVRKLEPVPEAVKEAVRKEVEAGEPATASFEVLDKLARRAAGRGLDALRAFYRALTPLERERIGAVVLQDLVPALQRARTQAPAPPEPEPDNVAAGDHEEPPFAGEGDEEVEELDDALVMP